MEQREASEAIAQISKPIKWIVPDFIRTDHATHLVVQQQGSEFTLLFFEVQAPVLTGTPEEQLAAVKEVPYVEARCVSKIVMSFENIPLAENNLSEALKRFQEMLLITTRGQEDAGTSERTELPTGS